MKKEQQKYAFPLRVEIQNNGHIPHHLDAKYQQLYYYQQESVQWILAEFMKSHSFCRANSNNVDKTEQFKQFKAFRGLLVGHSPGLGKTPISCFTLSVLFATNQIRYAIIIAPKTLIEQWRLHILQWCGNTQICIYNGSSRQKQLQSLLQAKRGVLITTYRTADIDAEILTNTFLKYNEQLFKNQEQNIKSMKQERYEKELIKIRKDSESADDLSDSDSSSIVIKKLKEKLDMQTSHNQAIPFRRCAFDFMILDEATEIKNAASSAHQSLKKITTFFKVALTGTPIMNNVQEMFNIINFLNPGFLGARADFVEEYDKHINQGRLKDATRVQQLFGTVLQKELIAAIQPIFIRHTKEQVNALDSDKTEIILWMNLSEQQNNVYNSYLSSKQFNELLQEQIHNKIMPFQLIQCLRKVCENILRLNDQDQTYLHEKTRKELNEQINCYIQLSRQFGVNNDDFIKEENTTEPTHIDEKSTSKDQSQAMHNLKEKCYQSYFNQGSDNSVQQMTQSDIKRTLEYQNSICSSKMHVIFNLLQQFQQKKQKTLIFTEYTTTLNLIQLQLQELNISYLRIDGSITSTEKRQAICTEFNGNASINCLIMSIKVGGMGLNLQGAQRVIIFSPHWNPQIEEQAVARAYRIGQAKDVVVYKLLIRNSIEEKLVARQFHKIQIANQITCDLNANIKANRADIKELFVRRNQEYDNLSRIQKNQRIASNKKRIAAQQMQQLVQVDQYAVSGMVTCATPNQVADQQLKEQIEREIADLMQRSLEDTLNANMLIGEANLADEMQIIENVVSQCKQFHVRPSCVRSTYQLRQNSDIEIEPYLTQQDEEILEQFRNGEQVFDNESHCVLVLTTIAHLRANVYPETETVVKQPKPLENKNIMNPRLLKLIHDKLPQNKDNYGNIHYKFEDNPTVQVKNPGNLREKDDLSSIITSVTEDIDESLDEIFAQERKKPALLTKDRQNVHHVSNTLVDLSSRISEDEVPNKQVRTELEEIFSSTDEIST